MGGRTACADVRFDQRIGQLILRPRMEPELEIGFGDVGARAGLVVDEFSVRPDPKHVLGRPLAEAEREGRKVGIRDRCLGGPAAALAARAGSGAVLLLADPGGPDHVSGHA